ncbi:hypothetical protein BDF20DRAFT_862594 [Mycotypha africana]|uniref:uncharacterized protein n=1 Tax=Mycotypha africana TaxID=64632 RepID=UPI002300B1FB|nr:uncharacterized protein BDF20DRAFT_862594 [Mycotypha africana]KAI8981666.1 hypothetical protein BDF20DRAFT_862594 [Mycotypha africana]
MSSSQQTHAVLPHLPKGMAMPNVQVTHHSRSLMMPGQKALPAADWRNDNNDENQQGQLVPLNQSNRVDDSSNRMVATKQGLPWTDRQDNLNLEPGQDPPPTFSAQPRRLSTLRHPGNAKTKQIYRMDNCLHPVDILCTRLESWRIAIKNMVQLFKKIAAVEAQTAKGYINASKVVAVPFENSNGQFLEPGRGGVQDVWASLRDYTMQHGILRHESAGYIEKSVIPSLRAIKEDIRQMIASISKDKGLKNSHIFDGRMHVDRQITRLDKGIQHFQRAPLQANESEDPFMLNLSIIHSIRGLCDRENELHDNIITLQKETGIFEQKIIENVRHTIHNFQEWRIQNKLEVPDYLARVMDHFDQVKPGTEWNEFIRRNQYNLLSENSSYKTEQMVDYPNKNSRYCRAVKVGPLHHKSGASVRGWVEGMYILTPAGFLHGYKTPQQFQNNPTAPSYSIFVPHCNLDRNDSDDSIELRGKEKRSALGLGTHHVFRARNRRETQEWFDALAHTCDQFRAVPLLESHDQHQFSRAPIHRELPPLPPSALPKKEIEGGRPTAGAIESGPSYSNQQFTDHDRQQQGMGGQTAPGAIGAAAVQRGDIGRVLDDQDPVLEGEEGSYTTNMPRDPQADHTMSRGINNPPSSQQRSNSMNHTTAAAGTYAPHPATAVSDRKPIQGGRPSENGTTYGETGIPFTNTTTAAATATDVNGPKYLATQPHQPSASHWETPSNASGGVTGARQGISNQQQQRRDMGEFNTQGELLDRATNHQTLVAYGPSGLQAQSQPLDSSRLQNKGTPVSHGADGANKENRQGTSTNEQVFAAYGPAGLQGQPSSSSRLTDHDRSIGGTARTGHHNASPTSSNVGHDPITAAYGASGLQAQSKRLADHQDTHAPSVNNNQKSGTPDTSELNHATNATVFAAYGPLGLQADAAPLSGAAATKSGAIPASGFSTAQTTGDSHQLANATNANLSSAYGVSGLEPQAKSLSTHRQDHSTTGVSNSMTGNKTPDSTQLNHSTNANVISAAYGPSGLQADSQRLGAPTSSGSGTTKNLAKEGTGDYDGSAPVNTTNEQVFSAYGASGLNGPSANAKQPSKQGSWTEEKPISRTGYVANVNNEQENTSASTSLTGKIKNMFGYGDKEETHLNTNFADEYNSANHLGAQDGVHRQTSHGRHPMTPHQHHGVGIIMDDGRKAREVPNDGDYYTNSEDDGFFMQLAKEQMGASESNVPVKPSTRFTTNANIGAADDYERTGTPPIAVQ